MQDADRGRPEAGAAALLAGAVQEAGALALSMFRSPLRQWTKGESLSPVSEADIAVDRLLRERLAAASSGYGWLSEETEDDLARLDAKHIWIVDPIDGTRAYLAGRPDWTISVALVAEGRPVFAAVFAPVTQELYLATAGSGATRNGAAIAATPGAGLAGIRIGGTKRHFNWVAGLDASVVSPPRIGSLALRLARVASGELDVAFAGATSHDWDLAAADLLVHEAGGALTTLAGQLLTYNRSDLVHGALVAAGRDRHAALIALARDRLQELA